MLTQRQKEILSYLDVGKYTTASFIAQQLDLSDRTIRGELKLMANILPEKGIELISKPRYGYQIKISNPDLNTGLDSTKNLPTTPQQRVQFILEYLLANEDFVKISKLCDLLYVGQSAISQYMKTIREILENYNLKLTVRPHYGMKIEGNEFEMRQLFSYYVDSIQKKEKENWNYKHQVQEISDILQRSFTEHQFEMNDFAFNNLVTHIIIALERVRTGNNIPMTKTRLQELQKKALYHLAEDIVEELKRFYQIDIPESECGYILIHLLGKQQMNSQEVENIIITEEMYETVDNMLRIADDEMNLDLSSDFNLRLSLALHLVPLQNRLKYNLNMRNPLLQEIKARYLLSYMIATTACVALKERYQKEISEDEIGYIALHINLALERKKEKVSRKNIIIVCSTGRGTAELLEYQYRKKFGKYINKLITCEVMVIEEMDLTDIDFIISTVDISSKLPVPIIRVQHFIEPEDETKVKKMLNRSAGNSIEKYFDRNLFLVNVPAQNKIEVINYMSAKIRNFYKVPRNFDELILLREEKATTEFGNLVAIPHPYRICTEKTFVCVMLLKNPILWDKKKVQLVFMLSVEKKKNRNLQKFYTITSELLNSKEYVKILLQEKSYSTLMNILGSIEERKLND